LFVALLLLMTVALVVFGVFLGGIDVYAKDAAGTAQAPVPGRILLKRLRLLLGQNWKASFGLFADLVLVLAALILAHYLHYDGTLTDAREAYLLRALPVVAGLKILTFYGTGLYRGIWRHAGTPELVRFIGVTTLASALVFGVLMLDIGVGRLPFAVACIDWMITTIFLAGIRFGYRGLHQYFASVRHEGERVLLYGAGHAGQLMLRELRQNRTLNLKPVGFIDDDPLKRGLNAQGLSVLGTQAELEALCRDHDVRKVLIAAPRMTEARMADTHRRCAALGVECHVFRFGLDPYLPAGRPAPIDGALPVIAHQE
jgi:UDP-GlcNAc:undecaprenyl-phosphate GlcNAc-1-phosphate transferase